MTTIRQSTIASADICLHRLSFLNRTDLPTRGSLWRAIGTAYHAGLADRYAAVRRHEKPRPLREQRVAAAAFDAEVAKADVFDWRPFPPAPDTWERGLALRLVFRLLAGSRPHTRPGPVAAVEERWELPFPDRPGHTRSGTFDLVLKRPDGWLIVDHKVSRRWTSRKMSPTVPQAAWYMAAWSALKGVPVESIRFVYDVIDLSGKVTTYEATRTRPQIEATLKRAALILDLLETGPFPPNPASPLCAEQWCDYWAACEYGKALKEET